GRLDPVDQGRLDRRSVGRGGAPRLRGPRRDLLVGEGRLLPRNEPRRRARGGDDEPPAPVGARRGQAALDPDPNPAPGPPPQPARALRERTASPAAPAAAVVAEAMVCLTLARAYREKFGGDHIDDVRAAIDAYKARIDAR